MKQTQEQKILAALQAANGEWINGQYFLRDLFLSQYHRAIWNLQHHRDKYAYIGTIEGSTFTDAFNFKSYRLVAPIAPVVPNVTLPPARPLPEPKQMQLLT